MSRVQLTITGILLILLLSLPLLSACGDDGDETEGPASTDNGEAKPDIHIGFSALITGKYAAYSPITWGYLDYIQYLNDNGGIDGAKIKAHWKDCQYEVDQSLAAYSQYSKEYDLVAFSGMGTGANLALAPRCAEDEIVLIAIGGEPEIAWPAEEWVFCTTPNHAVGAMGALKYATDEWDKQNTPRVGYIYMDMAFGKCVLDTLDEYSDTLGYEVVTKKAVPLDAVDTVSQAMALKNADVDIVYTHLSMKPMSMLCKEMERQGFEPEMVIGTFHITHPAFPGLAGGAGEGAYAWHIFEVWPQDIDNRAVEFWRDKAVEYNSGDVSSPEDPYWSTLYMWGLSIGATLEAGLREAASMVGVENIDAEALQAGLERVADYQPEHGGFIPPITFTSDNHEAYQAMSMMQVQDEKWARVTDWMQSPWEYEE